jgi:hypothetical protein
MCGHLFNSRNCIMGVNDIWYWKVKTKSFRTNVIMVHVGSVYQTLLHAQIQFYRKHDLLHKKLAQGINFRKIYNFLRRFQHDEYLTK